jgi:hypothetical protein
MGWTETRDLGDLLVTVFCFCVALFVASVVYEAERRSPQQIIAALSVAMFGITIGLDLLEPSVFKSGPVYDKVLMPLQLVSGFAAAWLLAPRGVRTELGRRRRG